MMDASIVSINVITTVQYAPWDYVTIVIQDMHYMIKCAYQFVVMGLFQDMKIVMMATLNNLMDVSNVNISVRRNAQLVRLGNVINVNTVGILTNLQTFAKQLVMI